MQHSIQTSSYTIVQIIFFVCVLSIIIAACYIMTLRSKMKNVTSATSASKYYDEQSLNVYHSKDVYTHTTTTRVPIQNQQSRGRAGGPRRR